MDQVSDLLVRLPRLALVDRGYNGRKEMIGIDIKIPGSRSGHTAYKKIRDRAHFRLRAAVEPLIGHLKSDYRIIRNFLKGDEGNMIIRLGQLKHSK